MQQDASVLFEREVLSEVGMVKSCGLLQRDLAEGCEISVSALCCQSPARAVEAEGCPTLLGKITFKPVAVAYSNPNFSCKIKQTSHS